MQSTSHSRLPVDEMIKATGSLASAISLIGLQQLSSFARSGDRHESGHTAPGKIPRLPCTNFLSPRNMVRGSMTAMWLSAELARKISSGSNIRLAREFQNKLEAFCLFEYVDYALSLSDSGPLSLSQLVARADRLNPYDSVWATEGVGHYYGQACLLHQGCPQSLQASPESLGIPKSSLVPLNSGLGLALAEACFEPENHGQRVDCQRLMTFAQWCLDYCTHGCEAIGFESLGLVARSLHPHLVPEIDELLSRHHPELVEYFWHGVGRALYFSPSLLFPIRPDPWYGLEMCLKEVPHELGKRNAIAGFSWALALVNIRHPEIVAEFLNRHATQVPYPEAIVNGFCSALLIWRDAQPRQRHVDDFVDVSRGSSNLPLRRIWAKYVAEPWTQTLCEHRWDEGKMGLLFRYQSSIGLADPPA